MKLSDALAGTQAALLASQFTGGFLRLFSGPPPASPDKAETGTLLGIVTVDAVDGAGLHFTTAQAALMKADEIWAFKALAAGQVGWFRLVQAGDTGADDLNALRVDGSVGMSTAPGDMNWADLTLGSGLLYTIDSFIYLIQPIAGA